MSKKHKKNKGVGKSVPVNNAENIFEDVPVETVEPAETEESPVDVADEEKDTLAIETPSVAESSDEGSLDSEETKTPENGANDVPENETLGLSADEADSVSNDYEPSLPADEETPAVEENFDEVPADDNSQIEEGQEPAEEQGVADGDQIADGQQAAEGQESNDGNGDADQEAKIKAEADEAAEKARIKAEKKARSREKRKENNKKFREWVKRHKIFVTIFIIVFALIIGAGVATLVLTRNMYFVFNASDIDKMLEKNKRTDFKLEKDVVYDGDLTLNGYIIDLNKHTLTVNGNLSLNNENDSVIAKRSVFKKDYETGGNLVVNGILTLNGVNYNLYSSINAEELKVEKGNVNVIGSVSGVNGEVIVNYASASENKTLTVNGSVDGSATLGESSVLVLNGSIKNVTGGEKIRVNDNATIGYVKDCASLYLEPQSKWQGFDSATVQRYYFVQTLASPVLLVTEKDGVFTCTISHVENADAYELTYADLETIRVNKNGSGNNTTYVLPHQAPGKYSLKVTAISDDPEQYKASASSSTSVEVYITLSSPVIEVFKESVENGEKKVALRFNKVEHALKYDIVIEGKTKTIDAEDIAVIEVDISEYVGKVGSYTIYVKATAPDTNYKASDNAMVSYVHTEKLTLGAITESNDDGFTISWDALDGAYAYEVKLYSGENQVADVVLSANVTTIRIEDANGNINSLFGVSEADAYSVAPKGKGFYKDGDSKKNGYFSFSKIVKKANAVKNAVGNWYSISVDPAADMWYNSGEAVKDSTLGGYIATAVGSVEIESEAVAAPVKPQQEGFYLACSREGSMKEDGVYSIFVYDRNFKVEIKVTVSDGTYSAAEIFVPAKF